MRTLARRGERTYLLVRDGVTDLREYDRPEGRILDAKTGRLYPWQNVHSILKFGYWDQFDGDQAILDPLLEDAVEVDGNTPPDG